MKQTPAAIVANASNYVGLIAKKGSPSKAVHALALKVNVDTNELAGALLLTGVTSLGPFNFATLPNDSAVIQSIRNNEEQAKEFIRTECRRRPISHVAAILRCSTTWVRAAAHIWSLELWPPTRKPELELPEETRLLQAMSPKKLRDLITVTLKHQNGFIPETAWSLGVGQRWLSAQLKNNGLSPSKEPVAGLNVVIRHGKEATAEERAVIKRRMEQLGSASAWGREVGLSREMAFRQAKLVGFQRGGDKESSASVRSRLKSWIDQTGYDGSTNPVGSAWLAANVLMVDYNEYDKTRLMASMRKLGFKSVRRHGPNDWCWIRDVPVETVVPVRYVDDETQKLGVWDLSLSSRERRSELRKRILEGVLVPSEAELRTAGLKVSC